MSQRISEMADARLPKGTVEEEGQTSVRTKRSSYSRRKECVNESDELVKYMSKLPGYLQRMEKGRGEESNVLNVGVLDWERLEKWKNGRARDCRSSIALSRGAERLDKTDRNMCSVATTSGGGGVPNDSCSNLGKVKASSKDLQYSVHGVRCTLESELASRDSLNKQEVAATCSNNFSGRDCGKSRRSRYCSLPEMGNSGGSLVATCSSKSSGINKETQKRAGEIHEQEARETATESGKLCVDDKLTAEEKAGLASEKQEFRNTLSGEPQMSLDDDNMRGINSSLGLRSQLPRSCPLSFDLERGSEDMMLPLGADLSGRKERFGGRRHSKTASSIFDQEMRQVESTKERNHSPSKRFSFSFGRLSKSFSVKEDSAAASQPLSSTSMRFDGSVENHCTSRVSPLRRLLKSKDRENNVIPSIAKTLQDTSRTRALFQLTIRNGIPLFQFVVDDDSTSSRSILGATMKSSDSLFKDDSVQYCTFYSVNEVKRKKSGRWLLHGHKEKKHCGFVYNVIGQMRLGNSDTITEQKSETTEAVLFDESEEVKGRREVAAVVIKKKPVEETSVIIPGGVHSFPEKGAPSPLISRWRSGGLCDCGGWDVGCKLHVLSNKTVLNEFNQSFKLFDQERSEQESGPVLAMTEMKTGIYRVEFGSFVSPLQAFFVCVTVITCASETKKTTGKSSSPFAPPLSPVGRV